MSRRAELEAAVKDAMRAGDATTRDTLRMVLSRLKADEIDLGREVDDDEVLAALTYAVKTRRESIQQFDQGGRQDLADAERAQVAVLERFLPAQLSEDELREVLRGLIAEVGAESKRDMGKVMKALTARHQGAVDGKLASRLVSELLA